MASRPCPGGCGLDVPSGLFACDTCWCRLPYKLRIPIAGSFCAADPDRYMRAIRRAHDWYIAHPRGHEGQR